MTRPPSAVETFIDAHGAQALASATGKSVSAVRLWRHRHVIPRTVWPELVEKVPGTTLEGLKEIEALSAPFKPSSKRARAA